MRRFSTMLTIAIVLAAAILWFANSESRAATGKYAMKSEKDVPITASDGAVLRANIFRPEGAGRFPVIMAHGPYGKDAHFADAYKEQWENLMRIHPEVCQGSSCKYLRWETVDPERWVPDGYVVIHVDSRGTGKSPGFIDPYSPRENLDFYEAIEWAAAQPWSNGKVGLIGISYYAANQWQVASLQPPHLAAIIPWEGYSDHYRDSSHHGGILSNTFPAGWWARQILPNQNGNGKTNYRDRDTGERTTGPALGDAMLSGNRIDILEARGSHPLDDAYYHQRTPDLSRIKVPVLSAGNWGGMGLHLRGNVEGFMRAGSKEKWLELHAGTHYESFYLPEGIALQKKFFDHYLKGVPNGWEKEPRVQLAIRRPDAISKRMESEWPLARTRWTRYYLNASDNSLTTHEPNVEAAATYSALTESASFTTPPFQTETEITGPLMARLWVSSSTTDADIFATLQAFGPDGKEVTFDGASDPAVPIAQGWLRASHRKIDPKLSTAYRPYLAHDEIQKLKPGEFYAVDVEIWPTSITLPRGYRLVLTVQGTDFQRPGVAGRLKGSGPFLHTDPQDRKPAEFAGKNSIATGGDRKSYLLLPVIPPPAAARR